MRTKLQSENEDALVVASVKVNCHIACEDEVHIIGESPVEPCVVDFGCTCDR